MMNNKFIIGRNRRTAARVLALLLVFHTSLLASWAQIGKHRNDFAVGVNGGYVMSSVSFLAKVPQDQMPGMTAGITMRYTCEKYFNSICSVVAEVNYAQLGWRERIEDDYENPVPILDPATSQSIEGTAEAYERRINYVQIPVFARLGWGRERRGFQAFFQVGPQIGLYLNEEATYNFDLDHPNTYRRMSAVSGPNIGDHVYSNMYHLPVENKFDYGIGGGLGLEFSHPKLGHFLLDGRYYYALGNIYGNSKRDYFATSNFQNIVIKLSCLFDISRTKNDKIK